MATVTSPVLTDATGANIVTKLEAIKNAVQPVNACTDIDITIPTSGWSGSSPYTYTYATAHVTPGCSVKVSFLEGSEDTSVFYLEYEKVSTGVRFTAPSLPDSDIPVRIHILAADAESVAATSADQVTTNAVLGASNVQQALGTLHDQIATKNISNPITLTSGATSASSIAYKTGNVVQLGFQATFASLSNGTNILSSIVDSIKPKMRTVVSVFDYNTGKPLNGTLWISAETIYYYGDSLTNKTIIIVATYLT